MFGSSHKFDDPILFHCNNNTNKFDLKKYEREVKNNLAELITKKLIFNYGLIRQGSTAKLLKNLQEIFGSIKDIKLKRSENFYMICGRPANVNKADFLKILPSAEVLDKSPEQGMKFIQAITSSGYKYRVEWGVNEDTVRNATLFSLDRFLQTFSAICVIYPVLIITYFL